MPNDIVQASAEGLPNSDHDAELIKLGADLEEVHRQRLEIDGNPAENANEESLYAEHWALREKIEAIPGKTDAGRRIKARAVEMAFHFDQASECNMPGSFVTLSHSLCRDLLAAAPCVDQTLTPDSKLAAAIARVAEARAKQHPLSALIEAQRRARAVLEEVCDFTDFISEDDPDFPALEAEHERRNAAEEDAMAAVCAYPARTIEDAAQKAAFLLKNRRYSELAEYHFEAFLRSFLPAWNIEAGGNAND